MALSLAFAAIGGYLFYKILEQGKDPEEPVKEETNPTFWGDDYLTVTREGNQLDDIKYKHIMPGKDVVNVNKALFEDNVKAQRQNMQTEIKEIPIPEVNVGGIKSGTKGVPEVILKEKETDKIIIDDSNFALLRNPRVGPLMQKQVVIKSSSTGLKKGQPSKEVPIKPTKLKEGGIFETIKPIKISV